MIICGLKFKIFFILAILCMVDISCNYSFDKTGWLKKEDIDGYILRDDMLKDLLLKYKLKGLKYKELISLIGKPQIIDSNIISYQIMIDYGNDIDPIHRKYLTFRLNGDSLVVDYKIDEWKK